MVVIAGCIAALAIAGTVYWYLAQGPDPAHASRSARNAVQVTVATASRQDVPIYLLGSARCRPCSPSASIPRSTASCRTCSSRKASASRKATLLAKIDPRLYQAALDQAKAHKAQDDAQLIAAEKDLVRFQTLVTRNAETQQNVDLQQAKVDQTKASIDADIAAIETAQTNLDYTNIAATTDGRMGVRMVDPGNIVHASDQSSIAILTQTEPAVVIFTLPAQTLDDVREAMKHRRCARSPPTIATMSIS